MKKFINNNWKPFVLAAAMTGIFFAIPYLCYLLTKTFVFSEYVHFDAPRFAAGLKRKMGLPISKLLPYAQFQYLIPVFYLILAYIARWILRQTRPYKYWIFGIVGIVLLFLYTFPNLLCKFNPSEKSISGGHVANGNVQMAHRVPFRGSNFSTYSFPGYLAGRTYANSSVKNTILDAYRTCEKSSPESDYVIGEIGDHNGGQFLPHRTHQNGLSVDFMTPLTRYNKSYTTHNIFNLWGYTLEFNDKGATEKFEIDWIAMAHHLIAVKQAARKNGLKIQKVIFDPVLRQVLKQKTKSSGLWAKIESLPWTKSRVVWRHDDHYHIDFALN